MTVTSLVPARADDGLQDAVKHTAMVPVCALSVASGLVLGVPVAIFRRASTRMINYTESVADAIGGRNSAPPMIFGSVIGFPMGLVVGTGEGIYAGTTNAVQKGVEKPFSAASFSMDENLTEH